MQPMRPKKRSRPAKRRRGELSSWIPIMLVGLVAIGIVIGIVLLSQALEEDAGVIIPPQATTRTVQQSGSAIGDDDAPVTIIEYSAYTCHVCRDFTLHMLPQLERDYIDTGEVRLELRPLAVEGLPFDASNAFLCAADQGRSADYHDVLFANFEASELDAYKSGRLKEYAKKLGMDTDAFNACVDDGQHRQDVLDITETARGVGIESTPTFFLGPTAEMRAAEPPFTGQTRLNGVGNYKTFQDAIDALLTEAQ